jgi:hypothetical protein
MHLYPIDRAVHRVGRADTAFSYRDARWAGVTFAVDPDPSKAELLKRWTIDYWEALHPYSAGGVRQLHDGRGPIPGPSYVS